MPQLTRVKTGGRKPGTPNKTTAEVRQLAMTKAPEAIQIIADLMANSKNDVVRLHACKEMLNRASGKPTESHELKLAAPLRTKEERDAIIRAAERKCFPH